MRTPPLKFFQYEHQQIHGSEEIKHFVLEVHSRTKYKLKKFFSKDIIAIQQLELVIRHTLAWHEAKLLIHNTQSLHRS